MVLVVRTWGRDDTGENVIQYLAAPGTLITLFRCYCPKGRGNNFRLRVLNKCLLLSLTLSDFLEHFKFLDLWDVWDPLNLLYLDLPVTHI